MATITSKIRIGLVFSGLLVLLTGCGLHQSSQAPARTWETNQEEQQRQSRFIKKIGQNAKLVYQKKHQVLPSIIIAQAIIESDWGRSDLATKANNLFGVKGQYEGQQILMNTDEYESNQRTTIKDYFKVYPSLEIAIQDHSDFLSVGTYATLTNLTNYTEQADLLQKAGYATDPNYATKIKKAIQDYDLAEYDA